jgi:RNA polymerase sigma-70 factor (ECF subfamily)
MNWRPAALLRYLRELSAGHDAEELSDRELVERYAARRDEAAFEALLLRHGPLVWRVCWHVTRHEQNAEDAFQATFLVMARRAVAIRKRSRLPVGCTGWLTASPCKPVPRPRAGRHRSTGSNACPKPTR